MLHDDRRAGDGAATELVHLHQHRRHHGRRRKWEFTRVKVKVRRTGASYVLVALKVGIIVRKAPALLSKRYAQKCSGKLQVTVLRADV